MINTYIFDAQIQRYIRQFCAIFHGLQVSTGIGECGVQEFISVPIVVGNRDRVVAALAAGNTQNRAFSLPAMSAHLTSIDVAPERRKVQAFVDQRVTLPVGGVFPNDLTVVKRAMPIPYNITIEVSIYVSNLLQRDQILEQILVLFNPDLQLQKSDGPFDFTRITRVELLSISSEENYPIGADRRMIQWTLSFVMPIFLTIPMGVKDDLVRRIVVRIGDLDSMTLNEVNETGQIQRYGDPLAVIDQDTRPLPTPAECVFNQTTVPTAPQVDDTWYNPTTSLTMRYNGIGWTRMEVFQKLPVGPIPPEVA